MRTLARAASALLLAAIAAAAAAAAPGSASLAGPTAAAQTRLAGRRLLAAPGGSQAGPEIEALVSTGPAYYIAADPVDWNFAPSGLNLCSNEELTGGRQLSFKHSTRHAHIARVLAAGRSRPR